MEKRKRIRDFGIVIGKHATGVNNSLTDIQGIKVGHETVWHGEAGFVSGNGPARTGVTVILPNEDIFHKRLFAGVSVINGAGELTGSLQIDEWGILETPIALTGSASIGAVTDGIKQFMVRQYPELQEGDNVVLPVVGECNDSSLHDSAGNHVTAQHVFEAIRCASTHPVVEGAVGAGTGMVCFRYKGGIGSSSRVIDGKYTVAALVLSNFGQRKDLRIDGIPVGRKLSRYLPTFYQDGSAIVVIATDAPLLPHQLKRLAKRAAFGLSRTGSYAHNGSGEIAIAFSTAQSIPQGELEDVRSGDVPEVFTFQMIHDELLSVLFEAAADAVEEAVLNSLFMASSVKGRLGEVHEIPVDEVLELLKQSGYFSPDSVFGVRDNE